MKRIILSFILTAIVATAPGCRIIQATGPNGTRVSIESLGNTTSWELLSFDQATGAWVVKNFNNDQAASYMATLNLLGQLATMAAKGGVAQTNPPPAIIRNSFQAINP